MYGFKPPASNSRGEQLVEEQCIALCCAKFRFFKQAEVQFSALKANPLQGLRRSFLQSLYWLIVTLLFTFTFLIMQPSALLRLCNLLLCLYTNGRQSQPVHFVSLIHSLYLEAEQARTFQLYFFDKRKAKLSKSKFLSKYVFDSQFTLGLSLISQKFPITAKLLASL